MDVHNYVSLVTCARRWDRYKWKVPGSNFPLLNVAVRNAEPEHFSTWCIKVSSCICNVSSSMILSQDQYIVVIWQPNYEFVAQCKDFNHSVEWYAVNKAGFKEESTEEGKRSRQIRWAIYTVLLTLPASLNQLGLHWRHTEDKLKLAFMDRLLCDNEKKVATFSGDWT